MSDVVVDSSVVVKWVLNEPDSALAQQLLVDSSATGNRLVILDLALPEAINAVWKHYRRQLITADEARIALADLRSAPVHVEPAARLLEKALDIGMRYDRAIYDALFVALAIDLGLPGVTADQPLVNTVSGDYPQICVIAELAVTRH